MTFDAPLLLFLAPLAGGCLRLRRLAGPRHAASGMARAMVSIAGSDGPRAGRRAPAVLALAALWPRSRSPGRGRDGPRSDTETRALSMVFAVDISRSDARGGCRTQQAAARGPRGTPADPGSRGRPTRSHRICGAELYPGSAHGRWRRHPDVSRCAGSRSGERGRHQPGGGAGPGNRAVVCGHRRGRPGPGAIHRRRSPRHAYPRRWPRPRH